MRSLTLLAPLSLLTTSVFGLPQVVDPKPVDPKPCITLPVILSGLSYEFTLIVQGHPRYSGETVTFFKSGDGYGATIGGFGEAMNMTFKDSHISLNDGKHTGFMAVPRKVTYQNIVFAKKPADPIECQAAYGCDPKTGKSVLVLSPAVQQPQGLPPPGQDPPGAPEFCIADRSVVDGPATLAVKPRGQKDALCLPVSLVITDGIRPLPGPNPTIIMPTLTRPTKPPTTPQIPPPPRG